MVIRLKLKSLACFIRVKSQNVGAGWKNGFEGPTPTPKIRENLDFFLIFSEAVDMANRGHLRSFDVIIGRFWSIWGHIFGPWVAQDWNFDNRWFLVKSGIHGPISDQKDVLRSNGPWILD